MRFDAAYWSRFDQQRHAVYRVREALRKGTFTRGDCAHEDETCRGQIEGHHEDDDKPLDVIWLCVKHHHQLHAERRRAEVAA